METTSFSVAAVVVILCSSCILRKECVSMPALCAHPLAAIPFKRYGLPVSALIIGSMMPDGVYFIPFHPLSEQFGHTLWGIVGFCLPIGMVLYWVFHAFIKFPAFSLLPVSHQTRVWAIASHQPSWSIVHVFQVLLALCVGTVTHIAWDSCTHWYGWTVQHVSFLRIALLHTTYGTLRLYKVLQHGSTLAGTAILVWWYVVWLQTVTPSSLPVHVALPQHVKRLCGVCLFGVAICCGLGFGYIKVPLFHDLRSFSYFVVYTAKVGITTLVAGFFMFSSGWHLSQYYRGKASKV